MSSVSLGKQKIRSCNLENRRCVLEKKSMAAYSTMSVFHSKSGKGWDREFIEISQAAMDLGCDVSTWCWLWTAGLVGTDCFSNFVITHCKSGNLNNDWSVPCFWVSSLREDRKNTRVFLLFNLKNQQQLYNIWAVVVQPENSSSSFLISGFKILSYIGSCKSWEIKIVLLKIWDCEWEFACLGMVTYMLAAWAVCSTSLGRFWECLNKYRRLECVPGTDIFLFLSCFLISSPFTDLVPSFLLQSFPSRLTPQYPGDSSVAPSSAVASASIPSAVLSPPLPTDAMAQSGYLAPVVQPYGEQNVLVSMGSLGGQAQVPQPPVSLAQQASSASSQQAVVEVNIWNIM